MVENILEQAYFKIVSKPLALNNYKPWSAMTYGEMTYKYVLQIIDTINITPNDVFIDVGSGIGQIVLQMAGLTKMRKCIGIECVALRAKYARDMKEEFERMMKFSQCSQ